MPLQLAAKRDCVLYVPCVAFTMPKRMPAFFAAAQLMAPWKSETSTPSTVAAGLHAVTSSAEELTSPVVSMEPATSLQPAARRSAREKRPVHIPTAHRNSCAPKNRAKSRAQLWRARHDAHDSLRLSGERLHH